MSDEETKIGRPTKYKEEFCKQAEKLCLKGFIDDEIADFFEVDVATINRWKLKHPLFCESLKSGKRHSDSKVVDALYNRALGYNIKEVKEETGTAGDKTTTTTKHIPADVGSMCFWLRNRDPHNWRNNPDAADDNKDTSVVINIVDAVKPDA